MIYLMILLSKKNIYHELSDEIKLMKNKLITHMKENNIYTKITPN